MQKTTRWTLPCSCVVVYQWDTEVSEDERKHMVIDHVHCGAEHPKAVIGEHVEGSALHRHHVDNQNSKE